MTFEKLAMYYIVIFDDMGNANVNMSNANDNAGNAQDVVISVAMLVVMAA